MIIPTPRVPVRPPEEDGESWRVPIRPAVLPPRVVPAIVPITVLRMRSWWPVIPGAVVIVRSWWSRRHDGRPCRARMIPRRHIGQSLVRPRGLFDARFRRRLVHARVRLLWRRSRLGRRARLWRVLPSSWRCLWAWRVLDARRRWCGRRALRWRVICSDPLAECEASAQERTSQCDTENLLT